MANEANCLRVDRALYKNEIVLWANDMESATTIEQAIRRIYNYYDARTVTPNEELTRSILDILAPEFGAFQV
jgi:hypothetical protein